MLLAIAIACFAVLVIAWLVLPTSPSVEVTKPKVEMSSASEPEAAYVNA